jgi:adenine-specific DNA-methyltransferase
MRRYVPAMPEAGCELASEKVMFGKKALEIPKNPVVHRGQDPELFWLNKYGHDDREDLLRVDVRSLYRYEHIAPEILIQNLYKVKGCVTKQMDLFSINELFGNALNKDELDKVSQYYKHQDGWTNRLIQGDSLLVMTSLLEREGMAGQVQMVYMDPPYGIKYGGNWQIRLNNMDVQDGKDENLTSEPEQIKAFRDTWELGIHSYLSYLRDRLLVAKELLKDSGSCFVQIGPENVHLIRCLMDEVFGSENFVNQIAYRTTSGDMSSKLQSMCDYILWYSKDIEKVKCRKLFVEKVLGYGIGGSYNYVESEDGSIVRKLSKEEIMFPHTIPKGWRVFRLENLKRLGFSNTQSFVFEFNNKDYYCGNKHQWKTNRAGMEKLKAAGWLIATDNTLHYKSYFDRFPLAELANMWVDTGGASDKEYVVQTSVKPIQRCLLMSTDPGDLVLDPTCGSGTTAYVAEQWGRRWITIDTSRIALNIAKQRLMTAVYPYYRLYDEEGGDIRQGFKYKTVPHITLKSLVNDEPAPLETLYDQPEVDKRKLRVSGPFTVETLQNFEPVNPSDLDKEFKVSEVEGSFEELIKQHLLSAGIKNGRKEESVVFRSVELLSNSYLHAEGFYMNEGGERKAYFHIGPKFGTVSKVSVNEAIKECRMRGDGSWLVILGFSFESDIEGSTQTMSMGKFEVTKARIHDDLLQEGLKKKPGKSVASFVTIGEPDILLHSEGEKVFVEIQGLDIYDPIQDELKPRSVHDIAYWMLDDDYDGSNFVVKQVFFCGGDKDAFDRWRKGLDGIARDKTKKNLEKTLRIEVDDEAFDRLYGHISHPIEVRRKGQRIAVRLVSQFGEECTKVLSVG